MKLNILWTKNMFDFLPARIVLAILAFFGFINLYLIRFGFSVISVAMITPYDQQQLARNASCAKDDQLYSCSLKENKTTLDWDERTRALVLGVFSYGYCLTQIIGGRLAEKKGSKYIFGPAVVAPALLHFLIPVAAKWSFWGVVVLRFVQGVFQGVSWPSMYATLAWWIPPNERSRFVGIVMFGATFGMVLILPFTGFLSSAVSWEGACYISGCFPLFWGLFWFSLMHSKPKYHPRISQEEKSYIQAKVAEGGTRESKAKSVPWKAIFTSLPFISLVVSGLGNAYGFTLITTQMPNFFSNVLQFSIMKTGFVSGLPFLFRYVGAILFSSIVDFILSRKLLTVSTTRRIFSVVALLIPAAIIAMILFFAFEDPYTFLYLLCFAMIFNGAIAPSIIVNASDIAPNYSGTLFGILNTVSSVAGFVYLLLIGEILNEGAPLKRWKLVFWLAIPTMGCSEIFYLIFMSGVPLPWNFQEDKADEGLQLTEKGRLE